jgi:hypothetical protein
MAGRRDAPEAEPAPPKGDAGLFALLTDSTRIHRLTHILTNAPLTTNAGYSRKSRRDHAEGN